MTVKQDSRSKEPIVRDIGRGPRVSAADPSSTARKTVEILEALANSSGSLALNELARHLHSSRSSVVRIISSLEKAGLIRRDSETRRLSLTFRLLALGSAALDQLPWYSLCKPHVAALSKEVGEIGHLAVLDGPDIIYLAKSEPTDPAPFVAHVGGRASAYCTGLGKVLLAAKAKSDLELHMQQHPLVARTSHTITDPQAMHRELELVRRRGYAVDDEENRDGVKCVAAPIVDYRGMTIAAISVAVPAYRLPDRAIPPLAGKVRDAAARASRDLGSMLPMSSSAGKSRHVS
jgi:IclR family acetate operon transcriptional repressor